MRGEWVAPQGVRPLSYSTAGWRSALCIVKPGTVVSLAPQRIPIVLDLEGPPRPARPPAGAFAAGCGRCPRRPPQAFHGVLFPRNPLMGQIPALGAALDGPSCFVRIYLQRICLVRICLQREDCRTGLPLNGYVDAITAFNNGQLQRSRP